MSEETEIAVAEPTDRMAKARAARAAKAAAKKETEATVAPEATIDILAEIRQMREGFDRSLERLQIENADLKHRLEQMAEKSSNLDENGVPVNALPPNFVDLRENRPGTLDELVEAAELQAKANGDKDFDKERVRRIYLGLPVVELHPFICSCGKGFGEEAGRDACQDRHDAEALKRASRRAS